MFVSQSGTQLIQKPTVANKNLVFEKALDHEYEP